MKPLGRTDISKRSPAEHTFAWVCAGIMSSLFALVLCISFATPPQAQHAPEPNASDAATSIQSAATLFEADEWDPQIAPDGYLVKGSASITYVGMEPGTFIYSGPDAAGRTGCAYACISKEDFEREGSEPREGFRSDADSLAGWGHNIQASIVWPDGDEYSGWMLNRCHLVADSLGGMASADNLFTGTRFANTGYDNKGGMAYAERKVSEYLDSGIRGSYVYYRVTPVYVGDEQVPRSVYMDILSDDGSIDEHVEVFNVTGDIENGWHLDYSNGTLYQL